MLIIACNRVVTWPQPCSTFMLSWKLSDTLREMLILKGWDSTSDTNCSGDTQKCSGEVPNGMSIS